MRCDDLDDLDVQIAVIGMPYGYPYNMPGAMQPSGTAPYAIRTQSIQLAPRVWHGHNDYDLGGEIFGGRSHVWIVDCADVAMESGNYAGNAAATTAAVRDDLATLRVHTATAIDFLTAGQGTRSSCDGTALLGAIDRLAIDM